MVVRAGRLRKDNEIQGWKRGGGICEVCPVGLQGGGGGVGGGGGSEVVGWRWRGVRFAGVRVCMEKRSWGNGSVLGALTWWRGWRQARPGRSHAWHITSW